MLPKIFINLKIIEIIHFTFFELMRIFLTAFSDRI